MAKPRVVLDAAHGGEDPGVKAGGEVEKDWNRKVVQALQKALEAAGYEVLLTRKKDEDLSREKRDEIINTSRAQAVIVVHAEREWTGKLEGPLLVVEPPHPVPGGGTVELARWGEIGPAEHRQSLRLARSLAQSLGIGTRLSSFSDSRALAGESSSDEGVILCAPHEGLRNLLAPAVVLVPLFLTSPTDRKRFSEASALAGFAARVADGLGDFLPARAGTSAPSTGEGDGP